MRSTATDSDLLGLGLGVAAQASLAGGQQDLEGVDPVGARGDRDDRDHAAAKTGRGAVG